MTNLFFVYGTLKSTFSGKYYLDSSKFLGNAHTKDKFHCNKGGGFPKAVEEGYLDESPSVKLMGELYEVKDKEVVDRLDSYEGAPSFYEAKTKVVVMEDGSEILANMYIAKEAASMIGSNLLESKDDSPVEWK